MEWYNPGHCYALERGRHLFAERASTHMFAYWASYDTIPQATFLDFIHNKGDGALGSSTMLCNANAADVQGVCRENTKSNKGTVKGVLTVLPELKDRADTNTEFLSEKRVQ